MCLNQARRKPCSMRSYSYIDEPLPGQPSYVYFYTVLYRPTQLNHSYNRPKPSMREATVLYFHVIVILTGNLQGVSYVYTRCYYKS